MGPVLLSLSADRPSSQKRDGSDFLAFQNRAPLRVQAGPGYLPGLDGWRALAITAVFISHEPWLLPHPYDQVKILLGWGVYLFFAISGVLICTRILEQEKRDGYFKWKPFYIRRFFRIQPAAWVYLAVIAILIATGAVHESWRAWRGALGFYNNFQFDTRDSLPEIYRTALTGHFWSLAVEEHFYLLIAVVIASTRRRLLAMGGLLILLLVLDHALRHLQVDRFQPRATQWILPYLLFPTLMAVMLQHRRFKMLAVKHLLPWRVYLATPFVLVTAWKLKHPGPLFSFATALSLSSVLFYACTFYVVATMLHPESWTTRLLELRPLRYVGRLSYSIYLWHVLFLLSARPQLGITFAPLVFLSHTPWRYLAVAVASLASYYLVERPFIRMGHLLTASQPRQIVKVSEPLPAFLHAG